MHTQHLMMSMTADSCHFPRSLSLARTITAGIPARKRGARDLRRYTYMYMYSERAGAASLLIFSIFFQ